MDQLKDILKQAIRHRFWIAVGIACLLPMIGYLAGAGPVQAKAAKETADIVSAEKDVKQYAGGVVPNDQYKRQVDEKREELTRDVSASHKKLYARQAPLLTWPPSVQDRFQKWGPEWPKDVDASVVQETILEYVNVYPKFVTQVYQTFKPFDPAEGTGIVASGDCGVHLPRIGHGPLFQHRREAVEDSIEAPDAVKRGLRDLRRRDMAGFHGRGDSQCPGVLQGVRLQMPAHAWNTGAASTSWARGNSIRNCAISAMRFRSVATAAACAAFTGKPIRAAAASR